MFGYFYLCLGLTENEEERESLFVVVSGWKGIKGGRRSE